MRKILILFFLSFLTVELTLSQTTYSTIATASGSWSTAANWTTPPGVPPGGYSIGSNNGDVFNIYGRINVGTTSTNQNLTVSRGLLSIQDTLIIYGNLSIGNNGDLYLANGSVLIIYGDLTIANQVTIAANSYLVIMGDFTKTGSAGQGSFTSDDQPSNVYIGGTINVPAGWADDGPNDVLNCTLPDLHDSSDCNYGNQIDLQDSPIGDLVNENCTDIPVISAISSDSPVIAGNTINLSTTADPGSGSLPMSYYWQGPDGYSTSTEDPSIASATIDMMGYYVLTVFNAEGCASKDSVYVEVTSCDPSIIGGTISNSQTRCEGTDVEAFTSIADASPGAFTYQWYYSTNSNDPATGTWNTISGATSTTYDAGPLTTTTYYYRMAIQSASCTKASNVLTITVYPVPVTGPQFHIDNTWND